MGLRALIGLAVAVSIGCADRDHPTAPARPSCDAATNIRSVPDSLGPWQDVLLMRINVVPDTQMLTVEFLVNRMPNTADSLLIIAHHGVPNWYWISSGRNPLLFSMRAGDLRQFVDEPSLDYVWRASVGSGDSCGFAVAGMLASGM